eukprot:6700256-Alexandrium_andersonii.AAC.1
MSAGDAYTEYFTELASEAVPVGSVLSCSHGGVAVAAHQADRGMAGAAAFISVCGVWGCPGVGSQCSRSRG